MTTTETRQSQPTVRERALTGAVLVTMRGFAVRLIGFATTIVVARFIAPDEFGVFMLGAAMVTAGTLLSDAGIAASLVRGPTEPTREDLSAVQGFQLLIGIAVAALALAIGLQFGRVGTVVAVMGISLPIITLRVPTVAMLERHLDFRPLVLIEIAETLAYAVFVTVTLAAGAGIWGLATAVIVRATVGTLAAASLPRGLARPRLDFARVRPILRFGLQYQGITAVRVANEQIFNVSVSAIAGMATLGLWGMAYRLIQIPQTVFESLRRVTFPAMARLNEAGEDLRETVERSAAAAGIVAGVVLLPVVALAPTFVPLIFGDEWRGAADALPGVCLGLMIGSPVSIAVAGYLLAAGDAGVVLRTAIVRVVAALALTLPLLPALGLAAVGLGYLAGAIVEAVLLGRATHRALGARLARTLWPSALAGAVSIGVGYLIGWPDGAGWPTGLLAAAASLIVFVTLMGLWGRASLAHVVALVRAAAGTKLRTP